jgi:hypothetical protein
LAREQWPDPVGLLAAVVVQQLQAPVGVRGQQVEQGGGVVLRSQMAGAGGPIDAAASRNPKKTASGRPVGPVSGLPTSTRTVSITLPAG